MMNGKHLKEGIKLATDLIEKEMEFINAINVYPVADGDTGTNMYNTMKGIWEAVKDVDSEHAGEVAEAVADAALESARGNSGVILSQFFWGFREGIGDAAALDRTKVAAAFGEGKNWAYQAVANPVEGTILTVMRETAEAAQRLARQYNSVPEILHHTYQAALSALEKTPEMLKKLGKPKIIDSGAYGFTLIVEGFVHALGVDVQGYRVRGMRAERETSRGGPALYCTNFMIETNSGTSADEIRGAIADLGDSIVVVGGHGKVKVHIHSTDPEKVKERLLPFGQIVQERIDQIW